MTCFNSRRGFLALAFATVVGLSGGRASGSAAALHDYGPAPELAGIEAWLNSDALSMRGLRGKVVLIDFWTYSCINCLRTLPYVTRWHDRFSDRGLVVIGVHTPEFGFEKPTRNVRTAIARHGVTYPVAQDNQYATWNAFENEYWPAIYLIDRRGHVMLKHVGEGDYDDIEHAIESLVNDTKKEGK
jgi:thiol-disulfide isomerase/thioredoxin